MFKVRLPGLVAGLVLAVSGVVSADDRCRDVTVTTYEMLCTYQDLPSGQLYDRVLFQPWGNCPFRDPYAQWEWDTELWSSFILQIHEETYQECDPYPEAHIHIIQSPNRGRVNVDMHSTNSVGVDLSYQWTYTGDGGTVQGNESTLTVISLGGYSATVQLTVTDKYGDSSTATRTVYIEPWSP